MKVNTKRCLSFFLTLVMLLTVLPMNIFAEKTDAEKFDDYTGPATAELVRGENFTFDKVDLGAAKGVANVQSINFSVDGKPEEAGKPNQTGKVTIVFAGKDPKPSNLTKEIDLNVTVKGTADSYTGKGVATAIKGQALTTKSLVFTPALKSGDNVEDKAIDTSKAGTVNGTVKVTFADGSVKDVPYTVTVTNPNPSDAEKYNGKATATVLKGSTFDGKEDFIFTPKLPENAAVHGDPNPIVKTDTLGKKTGTVQVLFNDGSLKDVPYEVIVTDKKEYKLSFNTMGGKAMASVNTKNQKFDPFLVPERDGYEFAGWFLEKEYKNPLTSLTLFTKDTTLYAKWRAKTCNLYIKDVSVYSDRVTGKATPGATIYLYRSNGSLIDYVTADSYGYFTIYTKYFDYYYKDGKYYGYRDGYLIAKKTDCVSVKYNIDGYYYWGTPSKPNWDYTSHRIYPTNINQGNYSVSGKTSYADTQIFIYDGNTYLGSTWTDRYGNFRLTWDSPRVPTNRSLQYYIGSKVVGDYAKTPVIKESAPDSKVVKGNAGRYAKITVRDNNGVLLGSTTADKNGDFTVYLNRALKPGETIKVTADENTRYNSTTTRVVPARAVEKAPEATLVRRAYIAGYPDGTFRPQGNVTRAEAAQMFATLLNGSSNFGTSSQTKFSDANNSWYSPAINYIVGKGLISGYEDGTFRPDANITRAEFAQMISGYIQQGYPGTGNFKDVKGHWASDAIDKVYGNKSVSGYPDGTFKPNREITRAEAVTILNSVFNRTTTQRSLYNVNIGSLKTFKDVNSGFWAYYQILDAANNHNAYKLSDVDNTDIWK